MATYANYITYQILAEAGVPAGVIQFVPGPAAEVVGQALAHREFAALHFTGSTHVFKQLWKDIAANVDTYRSYPRIVGETGGKNFHLVHPSADVKNAVNQTIRAAFEYQGMSGALLCAPSLNPPLQARSARHCLGCTSRPHSGTASSRSSSSPRSRRLPSATRLTLSTSWAPSCLCPRPPVLLPRTLTMTTQRAPLLRQDPELHSEGEGRRRRGNRGWDRRRREGLLRAADSHRHERPKVCHDGRRDLRPGHHRQ
jgi:hypothetical protein